MLRVGIFFGGNSREREVSFAGGRTVFDNLDKSLFDAVPVFVDSFNNFVLLDWKYIYKGSIRDFYPSSQDIPTQTPPFQWYAESLGELDDATQRKLLSEIGTPLSTASLKDLIDFAFLTLHGSNGEDGRIQGLLEWLKIPYSGSGILSSAIGIDKAVQKEMMKGFGFALPAYQVISLTDWQNKPSDVFYKQCADAIGFPMVIKPAHQGSSIGVTILKEAGNEAFSDAVDNGFFMKRISKETWLSLDKEAFAFEITDFKEGLGLPVFIGEEVVYNPSELLPCVERQLAENKEIVLKARENESQILIEQFIRGQEFSCIVLEDVQGKPVALPPTEIVKTTDYYDYRSKYLPGLSRKITPIRLPDDQILQICEKCEQLYTALQFGVYARIDGFIKEDGSIFLNDPNTTSGMMPSSFFFHQAAEIGLNPSQFLTYIIYTSLKARVADGPDPLQTFLMQTALEKALSEKHTHEKQKKRIAVIMGGYSMERHISVESGRNVYEKLSSSDKYFPIPIFLGGEDGHYALYKIPINVLLKDNADDIKEKIDHYRVHPVTRHIADKAKGIIDTFSSECDIGAPEKWSFDDLALKVDEVFIALHGRPGEDGEVQAELEKRSIPYNGSGVESSSLTINKYATNELLQANGIEVARHYLLYKSDWEKDKMKELSYIEANYHYPFIAKPSDDGCSAAVKKINNKQELEAFATLMFRDTWLLPSNESSMLHLKTNEEFPIKQVLLIEELIEARGAPRFLEITGGMLTHQNVDGSLFYEVFEPSEVLAAGGVLSLEEKFLAGEGQNITPARFSSVARDQAKISEKVRTDLEKAARLLTVRGYCRIDAFVRIYHPDHVEVIVIEVNSLPGMTPATAIFHQAAINGYKPYQFIDQILTAGEEFLKKQAHAIG